MPIADIQPELGKGQGKISLLYNQYLWRKNKLLILKNYGSIAAGKPFILKLCEYTVLYILLECDLVHAIGNFCNFVPHFEKEKTEEKEKSLIIFKIYGR